MLNVKVIYGSSTGSTEAAANLIAEAFGVPAVNVACAKKEDFAADLRILGTSTWGDGSLQDDWESALPLLESVDFTQGKTAFFGLGDQNGFPDTFVNAMGKLCEKILQLGGNVIGKTSSEGYSHTFSTAENDGMFCGLALDDCCDPEKTPARIAAWVESLKKEM